MPVATQRPRESIRPSARWTTLIHQGRLDEAAEALRDYLRIAPEDAGALHDLAVIHARKRQFKTAVKLLRAALDVEPSNAPIWNTLAKVYWDIGRFGESADCLRKFIELQPGCANAYHSLGQAHFKVRELEPAIAAFEKACALESRSADPWHGLATALEESGRIDEAHAAYRRTLELNPDHPDGVAIRRLLSAAAAAGSKGLKLENCRVLEVYRNKPARIWEVKIGGGTIATTAGHPFYVRGRGWIRVRDLRPGDELLTNEGKGVPVESVTDTGRIEPVFNLRVEKNHTFFVCAKEGGPGFLVHNSSAPATTPVAAPDDWNNTPFTSPGLLGDGTEIYFNSKPPGPVNPSAVDPKLFTFPVPPDPYSGELRVGGGYDANGRSLPPTYISPFDAFFGAGPSVIPSRGVQIATDASRVVGVTALALASGIGIAAEIESFLGSSEALTWGGRLLINAVSGSGSAAVANALTQLTGDQPFSWTGLYKSVLSGGLTGGALGLLGKGAGIIGADVAGFLGGLGPQLQTISGVLEGAGEAISAAATGGGLSTIAGTIAGELTAIFSTGSGGNAGIEQHHLLPNQFADKFLAQGLDPEDFKIPLPTDQHRLLPDGIHTGPFEDSWNGQWSTFFKRTPDASRQQILDQLAAMRKAFGI